MAGNLYYLLDLGGARIELSLRMAPNSIDIYELAYVQCIELSEVKWQDYAGDRFGVPNWACQGARRRVADGLAVFRGVAFRSMGTWHQAIDSGYA